MAKNIHVIKDESLGGVEREYIEVDRKAEVGDLVTYVYKGERDGVISTVAKVNSVGGVELENPYKEINDDGDLSEIFGFSADAYRALEPTDIVHIDGERYRMVDRKAEVGERVLVKDGAQSTDECNHGKSFEVTEIDGPMLVDTDGTHEDGSPLNLVNGDYFVLVPVESEKEATSPQTIDDIIANLVARVAELERFIAGQRSENQLVYDNIEGVKDDIETWSREIETLKHASKETDDKIEMVIDDIVTLDERTQPKKVSIDADTFVKLIGGVRV